MINFSDLHHRLLVPRPCLHRLGLFIG